MDKRKALKEQYKARKVVGGVYRLLNKETGRFLLQSTDDMQSVHNLISFSKATGTCTLPPIVNDWKIYGWDAFTVEELERLEMGETQTRQEFQQDLEVLLELWSEKLPQENRY